LEPEIQRIFHFNINCTNLERSMAFYELLGFKVIMDFREGMKSQEMADAFGLPVADVRGVHLRVGDNEEATRIDLLEFVAPPPQGHPYAALNYTGVARVCLKTKGIWKVYENLKAKGVKFLSEPKRLPGTEVTIVCFKDPDGTFLELLEGDF
jgi:glyoxylase I family protein